MWKTDETGERLALSLRSLVEIFLNKRLPALQRTLAAFATAGTLFLVLFFVLVLIIPDGMILPFGICCVLTLIFGLLGVTRRVISLDTDSLRVGMDLTWCDWNKLELPTKEVRGFRVKMSFRSDHDRVETEDIHVVAVTKSGERRVHDFGGAQTGSEQQIINEEHAELLCKTLNSYLNKLTRSRATEPSPADAD